jgi:O-antigen ligase
LVAGYAGVCHSRLGIEVCGGVANHIFCVLFHDIQFSISHFPHFGVFNGAQSFLGSDWSGLFINKNVFGKICQCELLFALILTEMNRTLRLSVLVLASFLLLHSGSQSALIVAIFQSAYWICIPILRRRAHPAWVKSVIILGTLLASALVIILGRAPLLALLGRDATLTGRTDVWQVWINRAMQSFWLGAGPGSFTGNSSATADLTQAFSRYGTIYSPHNMYIGVFGEVGILGLITFTVPLIYMFAVLPFTREGRMPVICGLLAFTMALGGLSETQEVFGLGLNMFLLVLAYAPTAHRPSKSLLGVRAGISHGRQG